MSAGPLESRGRQQGARIWIWVVLALLLFGSRTIASYTIEYQWWKEMGQLETWFSRLAYGVIPLSAATVLASALLWIAHARGMKFAGESLGDFPVYARLATLAALAIGFLLAASTLDTWTVIRYAAARGLDRSAAAWHDPVFGLPLAFYMFDLPFYSGVRRFLFGVAIGCFVVYWASARGWQLRRKFPSGRYDEQVQIEPDWYRLEGGLESRFLRGCGAAFLLALALYYFLQRYEMAWKDHGFMVGIDYVDEKFGLPLRWLVIAACVAAAGLIFAGRWLFAGLVPVTLVVEFAVTAAVAGFHVRPNEISIERPYIDRHIKATRSAYGLDRRLKLIDFKTRPDARIDPARHKNVLDNVRLWDWQAFHNSVTQIQSLRPYYRFADTDVDRYTIDGAYRQVLLTPRELDINQLPDARTRWINPHFIYTHGYGAVLAEVSRITSDGLPSLLIQNAPPEIKTRSLKLTRPEIYYGEVVHEPVFVRTAQEEFNYPSGDSNVLAKYDGKGGFPISSLLMRVAAAIKEADANIVLTNYLTPESRMMIRRNVSRRLDVLAEFMHWDPDPYMVITAEGRLVWMVDGYTTSNAHPYSKLLRVDGVGAVNYIRNSVKATVDAYDGTTRIYIFDPTDPVIQAWRHLFPNLFQPESSMPPDLRAHARYPEVLFRVQAEIYRAFHMQDPQVFYNKEDLWDLAKYLAGPERKPQPVTPTYVMASLPGSDKLEFLLLVPFTPRAKDNMVGLMVARCDGETLGELVVLQLSKQELVYGPMQISARINQDQIISKDLTLWNQQGSQVLRAQTLVLPVEGTFLYVDPIYVQAVEARMPELKKVVLATGNLLVYADSYPEALARLTGAAGEAVARAAEPPARGEAAAAAAAGASDGRI
ncbi:MAG: UPF0182 family protein, partial [Bryobacteraceae bacterium]